MVIASAGEWNIGNTGPKRIYGLKHCRIVGHPTFCCLTLYLSYISHFIANFNIEICNEKTAIFPVINPKRGTWSRKSTTQLLFQRYRNATNKLLFLRLFWKPSCINRQPYHHNPIRSFRAAPTSYISVTLHEKDIPCRMSESHATSCRPS